MKKIAAAVAAVCIFLLAGCMGTTDKNEKTDTTAALETAKATEITGETESGEGYLTITASEAKEIMNAETGYIILDVREQDEYDEGHVPGAVLLSVNEISAQAKTVLPDKEQLILVYCRSGRRSSLAAAQLADLGYTNIKDFGGIIDWNYEIEK